MTANAITVTKTALSPEHIAIAGATLPAGELVLSEGSSAPVVLISAGIGATPMLGILAHLACTGSARRVAGALRRPLRLQ